MGRLIQDKVFLTAIFILLFFLAGLATLSDYGVNWDAISHLSRGQAFLNYYLTGEVNYKKLAEWNLYQEKEKVIRESTAKDSIPRQRLYFQRVDTIFFSPDIEKNEIPRISLYQNAGDVFQDIRKRYEFGHPHISDGLSSFFNLIFFQKLGLLNDVDSYRVYSVILSSLLVGLVFWWTSSLYGRFAGVVAVLSLSLYPLFWSESHFNNEKDIPEMVFITFMYFSFWKGMIDKSWKWILTSGVFFGLALGTKFNVIFSIFIVFPWTAIYIVSRNTKKFSAGIFIKKYFKLLLAVVFAPIIGILIVIGTWPLFWLEPVRKISRILDFYKTIGTVGALDQRFIGPFGINTYALEWILYTTPLVILMMVIIGVVVIFSKGLKEKNKLSLFILLMLIIPIMRVTWPGTNIYGGVRQIMEFIPALAMISGIGASKMVTWLYSYIAKRGSQFNYIFLRILQIFALLLFIPITLKLIEIHPNENVYFNPLIGGLKGAKERNFPGWGVSFGAPYREAIDWVNKNAEPGAKLTTGYEILSNIPGIFIRPDIEYKSNRSGYLRQGEYVISLTFQGTDTRSYFDMYLNRMIEPVYQIKVDGVPILKIWKNDKNYLKPQWGKEALLDNLKFSKNDKFLSFDVGDEVKLSRLEIDYNNSNCPELSSGYLMISKDGSEWERVPGVLPEEVRIKALGIQPSDGSFIEPFAGQVARFMKFYVEPYNTCVTKIEGARLYYFK